jgi:hypothetical protein
MYKQLNFERLLIITAADSYVFPIIHQIPRQQTSVLKLWVWEATIFGCVDEAPM